MPDQAAVRCAVLLPVIGVREQNVSTDGGRSWSVSRRASATKDRFTGEGSTGQDAR